MRRPDKWVWGIFLILLLRGTAGAHEDVELQIVRVSKLIEQDPRNAELRLKRGELYRVHEDWKAALEDYTRAASLDPELAVVDLCAGKMWNQAGDSKQARAVLERFLSRRPGHPAGLIEHGRALVKLGDRLAAVQDYTRALEKMEEPSPECYIDRAEALRAEGPAHLEEALRGLDEGIRKLGRVVTLRLAAIDLELQARRYDAALARVEEIARQSDRKDPWLARRGEILQQAGRMKEAREASAAALAAIEALPQSRRAAKFTQDLEKRLRAALEATDEKR